MNESSDQKTSRATALMVATTFPATPGDGTPEFVLTLARSVQAFDVTVVVPRVPGGRSDEVIDGVRIRRVRYFPKRWEGLATDAIMPTLRAQPWRIIEVPFLFLALVAGTWREARRRRATVINAHWIVPAGLVALAVHLLTGIPYVLTVHGADAYALRGRIARRLKSIVVSRAACVLPVSYDIATTLGLDVTTSRVLRMGVDCDSIREAIGPRTPDPGLVVAIGRLADKKGFDVLLSALAQVPELKAEILGDGPDRAALERQAADLQLLDRVRFRGRVPRSQVLDCLRRAQVVAIPSKQGKGGDKDGTPVVLCEAMAAGVPVIASDLGGLGECIVDGETGVLVPPGDVDALTKALRQVAAGELDLTRIATSAADEAAKSLDIRAIGRAYDEALLEAARQ